MKDKIDKKRSLFFENFAFWWNEYAIFIIDFCIENEFHYINYAFYFILYKIFKIIIKIIKYIKYIILTFKHILIFIITFPLKNHLIVIIYKCRKTLPVHLEYYKIQWLNKINKAINNILKIRNK